jgi:starch synthase
MQALGMAEVVLYYPNLHGGIARLLCGSCGELDIFVIDAPHLYARLGNPYVAPDGKPPVRAQQIECRYRANPCACA